MDSKQPKLKISAPSIDKASSVTFPFNESAYDKNPIQQIECSGMSTTSTGGWHLGVQTGREATEDVNEWITLLLEPLIMKTENRATPLNLSFKLVRSHHQHARQVANYAGPTAPPFNADLKLQRLGKASPFDMKKIEVKTSDYVRFPDFAPLLIVNTDSFNDMKTMMRMKLREKDAAVDGKTSKELNDYPIKAFRGNIVVKTDNKPWEEEEWKNISIGNSDSINTSFRLWKGCPRCSVPARNPNSGNWLITEVKNRLLFMSTLRKKFPEKCTDNEWKDRWQGVIFGVHAAADVAATTQQQLMPVIREGDVVKVNTRKSTSIFDKIKGLFGF